MKKSANPGKIVGLIVIAIIFAVLLVIAGFNLYQRMLYKEFYASAEKEFLIPGLSDGFTPQGLTIDEKDGLYLTCGYMKDGGASRIYVYEKKTGAVRYTELLNDKGKPDDIHAGGLAVYGDWLFLTAGEKINIYDMKEVRAKTETVKPVHSFDPLIGPAFCNVSGDTLFVGEFYIAKEYETPETHHMVTECGDEHKALMTAFKLDENADYGLASEVPTAVFSITDLAQGMCMTADNKICVSTSWGFNPSHIYVYDNPLKSDADGTYSVLVNSEKTDVPLYYLDSSHLEKTWALPPMSEEIVYENGRVLIMFESASDKYVFGKFSGGTYVYSLPIK